MCGSRWLHKIVAATLACAALASGASHAAPPRDIDRYAERVRAAFQTPGMVLVIVEGDRPSIVRSYGVRRLGEPERVDEHTSFAIGSVTKSFTSAVLATLVDEGKLSWDTKVSDALPGFKMHDAYATSEMTVRDLLVHRSGLGLGAGDLLFFPATTYSRAQIVHQLRFIEPATSFRSGYAYDNLLYIVAGQLAEAVGGSSWEQLVHERLLAPLRMSRTSTSSQLPTGENRAWPHARFSAEERGFGPQAPLVSPTNLDGAAPAGAINSSGRDISRWLEVQLGRGLDSRTNVRIYSAAAAREMWTPQTLMPISATAPSGLELAQPNFRAYALGWQVSDYRGRMIVAHGGSLPGFEALLVIVPERNVAFGILTNAEESAATRAMQCELLDHYLNLPSPDWITALASNHAAGIERARQVLAASRSPEARQGGGGNGPSLPLAQYAGTYRDVWYGPVMIDNDAAGLGIRFEHTPSMSGRLEHVRHDTFRTRWTDRTIDDAYVTFSLRPDGSVERIAMQAISPLADFSFDYQDLRLRPDPPAK